MASCVVQNARSSASLLNAGIGLSELADLRGIPFPFPRTYVARMISKSLSPNHRRAKLRNLVVDGQQFELAVLCLRVEQAVERVAVLCFEF